MAATLTQERFTGPDWTFERKFDGIRLLAFKEGDDVRLLSRNRLPQNCPPVAARHRRACRCTTSSSTARLDLGGRVQLSRVRLLWLDGRDPTHLPLDERRALLDALTLSAAPRTAWSRSTTPSRGSAPAAKDGRA